MEINVCIIILIAILIIYIISKLLPIKEEKKNSLFLITSFAFLFIVLAIRKPISDMDNYFSYFHYLNNTSVENFFNFKLEFFYKALNFVIGHIWENERFFIIVVDFIGLIGVYDFTKRYSKNYLLSIILYVTIGTYYMQFFILRQAIAISILLFSIKYIENKKIFPFLLCVISATLFHKASIIFLIIYPLCNIKFKSDINIKKVKMVIWTMMCVITFIFRKSIINFISQYFYTQYSSNIIEGEGFGRFVILVGSLFLSFVLDKDLWKSKNLEQKANNDNIFYNMALITIIIQILATAQSVICRLANLFCMGNIILLPNTIEKVQNERLKNVILVLIVFMCIGYSLLRPSIQGYTTIMW